MTKTLTRCTLAAALTLASSAHAVELARGGIGQVLLYPYYTVEDGAQTLLTVVNTTSNAKALRVRAREGRNGREVLNFNLYLGANDVWTGAIVAPSANSGAALLTTDTSCTVPAIRTNTELPLLGNVRYVPFSNQSYSGAADDAGSDSLTRTREGMLEVIEMATLAPNTPSAVAANASPGGGAPPCTTLSDAWRASGYWAIESTTDTLNPSGGLFGSALVVDVADGIAFQVGATALENFRDSRNAGLATRSRVIHTAPLSERPDLRDAFTSPGSSIANIDGRRVSFSSDRGVDAVSAVLASRVVANEFLADPGIGASTDWVITFPTKHYYTDPALVGSAPIPPFVTRFEANNPQGCEKIGFKPFSRTQATLDCNGTGADPVCAIEACGVVSVVAIDGTGSRSGALGSPSAVNEAVPYDAGYGVLTWGTTEIGPRPLRDDVNGNVWEGLPVIGFSATRAINANAQPGTLANYTYALDHRTQVGTCKVGACE